jgi:predicted AlkP superfamily pyrophosphatase or phosphodiesterase
MNLQPVQRTLVINVVGLTPGLLGEHTPRINQIRAKGAMSHIDPVLPAVTCSVQSSYLTGAWPDEHGVVGNGWYFREEAEVRLWRQSNHLVQRPKIWDVARGRDAGFTVSNMFWWYNMYSTADFSVTPRPMYPADGRKLPDVYSHPASLRTDLQRTLGTFPLFSFWGPASGIASTRWITSATIEVDKLHHATLTLVYLPHLDYALQKVGPGDPSIAGELRDVDAEVGRLIDHFADARIVILSEYGITPVSRPIHINRTLREHGFIAIREELGRELLDCGASGAFAVADHQIAHVYVNDPRAMREIRGILAAMPGVDRVYVGDERNDVRLNHPRAGDIVVLSKPDAWFTYYYWNDDARAPDFARTVDIHRKPGYDPVELFLDPAIKVPKLRIAGKLLKKKLGFRYLMDVIPLDATLVKGSHGAKPTSLAHGPLIISGDRSLIDQDLYHAPEIRDVLLRHVFD